MRAGVISDKHLPIDEVDREDKIFDLNSQHFAFCEIGNIAQVVVHSSGHTFPICPAGPWPQAKFLRAERSIFARSIVRPGSPAA